MLDKKTRKKHYVKQAKASILGVFLGALTFLGYFIMYPFEEVGLLIKELFTGLYKLIVTVVSFLFSPKRIKTFIKDIKLWFSVANDLRVKKKKNNAVKKSNAKEIKSRMSKRKKAKIPKVVSIKTKITSFLVGIIFTLVFLLLPIYVYFWFRQLPQPELLSERATNSTTKIVDRNGKLLYEVYIDRKYEPIELRRVPDNMINATLAIEDEAFYSHYGFDPKSILRAAKVSLFDDELQGGSTITQQLVKNVLLTPERTISRKIKELVLSVRVESQYTKSEILEFYLNNIPYGGTAYGVEAASQKFFGKNVWDLDLAEVSLLAGLPSAPSVYSPVSGNAVLAKERQLQVLTRMIELGYVSSEEADKAYAKELEFASQVEYIRAPHFVEYVRNELYNKLGKQAVNFGGLTVVTSLDLELQEKVQEIVANEVATNGARLDFTNGAAVVLDSKTGEILAYVGSTDYFAGESGKFDVVTALRQPGSSIKPVTYALGIENGLTAATLVDDSPITYQTYGQQYTPKNYDNRYHGKVTIRQALANSYNITAVKLINQVGVNNMVQLGIDMGIKNWVVGDGSYGMSITLGGKEVQLLNLANVYATLSRGGIYKDVTAFRAVRDIYGYEIPNVIPEVEKKVLSPETSYIISNILSDNVARSAAFGPRSQLYIPNKTIAVKTGTTNDIRDNLTIGYTPTYTVAVWVGNNDNTRMNPYLASGLTGAAPIWNRITTTILQDMPDEPFFVPEGIIIKVDEACKRTEVFNKSDPIPRRLCVIKKKTTKKSSDSDKN